MYKKGYLVSLLCRKGYNEYNHAAAISFATSKEEALESTMLTVEEMLDGYLVVGHTIEVLKLDSNTAITNKGHLIRYDN